MSNSWWIFNWPIQSESFLPSALDAAMWTPVSSPQWNEYFLSRISDSEKKVHVLPVGRTTGTLITWNAQNRCHSWLECHFPTMPTNRCALSHVDIIKPEAIFSVRIKSTVLMKQFCYLFGRYEKRKRSGKIIDSLYKGIHSKVSMLKINHH